MDKKKAALRMLISSVVLVILLFAQAITPLEAGVIFSVILLLLGISSKGFTKKL